MNLPLARTWSDIRASGRGVENGVDDMLGSVSERGEQGHQRRRELRVGEEANGSAREENEMVGLGGGVFEPGGDFRALDVASVVDRAWRMGPAATI